MPKVPFFDLSRQNKLLLNEYRQALARLMETGQFILGPAVADLEKRIARWLGVNFAVGVASGTDALHLALVAAGVGQGDEVITTAFTFIATAQAISMVGARPVFVDIDGTSFNLDPDKIEAKITSKTKAIMPVHLYGLSADMTKIMALANQHDLRVIEDACQAIGATWQGKKVGSFGQAGCFSFFPTKNLGCFGDGGLVATDDAQIAEKVKMLRGHGSQVRDDYKILGFNSRLDAVQAAVLTIKLPHLDSWNKQRQKNAALYRKLLAQAPVELPLAAAAAGHVYNQFTIKIAAGRRDEIKQALAARGIGAMVYYPKSVHLQEAYAFLGYQREDLPVTAKIQDEVLSLPIFPELTEDEITAVAEAVRECVKTKTA